MRRFSARERILALFTAIAVLGGILINAGVSWLERVDSADLIRRQETLVRKYRRLLARSDEYRAFQERYPGLMACGREAKEVSAALFDTFREQAGHAGLNVVRVKPRSVETGRTLRRVILEVEVQGRLPDVFRCLEQLEQDRNFVFVNALSLTPAETGADVRAVLVISRPFF